MKDGVAWMLGMVTSRTVAPSRPSSPTARSKAATVSGSTWSKK